MCTLWKFSTKKRIWWNRFTSVDGMTRIDQNILSDVCICHHKHHFVLWRFASVSQDRSGMVVVNKFSITLTYSAHVLTAYTIKTHTNTHTSNTNIHIAASFTRKAKQKIRAKQTATSRRLAAHEVGGPHIKRRRRRRHNTTQTYVRMHACCWPWYKECVCGVLCASRVCEYGPF